ncbi:MAG: hypothetical protein WDA16_01945 [Candidatus Thermoplasmatota archaeon]
MGCLRPLLIGIIMTLSGCFGAGFGPHFGHLELREVHSSSTYAALQGTAHAHVEGTLHGNDTGQVEVTIFMVGAPCPMGPPGTPDGSLARGTLELPDLGAQPRDASFTADVSGAPLVGSRYSIIVMAEGSNAIGPFFGHCTDFLAAS